MTLIWIKRLAARRDMSAPESRQHFRQFQRIQSGISWRRFARKPDRTPPARSGAALFPHHTPRKADRKSRHPKLAAFAPNTAPGEPAWSGWQFLAFRDVSYLASACPEYVQFLVVPSCRSAGARRMFIVLLHPLLIACAAMGFLI
jgi:hypothetical protein